MDSAITFKSNVMHGEPCFTGTRVAVQTLFDWLEEGHDTAYFLDQFASVKLRQSLGEHDCYTHPTTLQSRDQ